VEEGEKLNRVPLHSVRNPNSHTKPRVETETKRERVRKDSIRVEEKRKHLGESERRFISEGGGKEHLVRRYPGNARSSF
jgi:hypothetical protein